MSTTDRWAETQQRLSQESNNSRQSAATIAAKFEDCLQKYDQLCSAMQGNKQAWGEWYTIVDTDLTRLQEWGNDTGASSRSLNKSLDHALRKACRLRETVYEYLQDLLGSLQIALESVLDAGPYLAEHDSDKLSRIAALIESESSTASSDGSLSPRSEAGSSLEEINDLVDALCRLGLTLRDPVDQDTYASEYSDDGVNRDRDIAKSMFPKAPESLVNRLALANWRRRQYIKSVRNQRPSKQGQHARSTGKLRKKVYLGSTNGNSLKNFAESFSGIKTRTQDQSAANAHFGRGIPSSFQLSDTTASSAYDSVFSRSNFRGAQSVTSFAESEEIGKDMHESVPRPPAPLMPGNRFSCPYCPQEVVVGDNLSSEREWEEHIFIDMEPYICTSTKCPRSLKTYGSRDEWFSHELQCHLIPKAWHCRTCREKFGDEDAFGEHLGECHAKDFGRNEIALMLDLCSAFSASPRLPHTCPLCCLSLSSVAGLKDHVAIHLEQLSLRSLETTYESDCEDDDDGYSENLSHGESENQENLEALGYFVKEQMRIMQPSAMHPPDLNNDNDDMDFVEDLSSNGSEQDSAHGFQPQRANSKLDQELWKIKVNNWTTVQDQSLPPNFQPSISRVPTGLTDPNADVTPEVKPVYTNLPPKLDNFTGRNADLTKLHQMLSVASRNCVLIGAGGIGKTSTAIEYTHRYQKEYAYIFWIQAETGIGCADTFAEIATQLELGQDQVGNFDPLSNRDLDRLANLGREFLENTKERWLLVFDNVETWLEIIQYLPAPEAELNGSILITTRAVDLGQASAPSNFVKFELKSMALEDSRRLLLLSMDPGTRPDQLSRHPEYALAGEVAKRAERLPLSLALIAGYIQYSRCTLSEFIEIWNERLKNTRGIMKPLDPLASTSTDLALQTVWNIGLRELSGDAKDLINIMAFLDNETIQKSLLVASHEEPCLEFLHSSETFRYRRMTRELGTRKLISTRHQSGQEILSLHRLLQSKIIQELDRDPKRRGEVFTQAFTMVRKRLPRPNPTQMPDPSKWEVYKENLQHVLNLRRQFDEALDKKPQISGSLELAQLFYDAAFNCWERESSQDGMLLLDTAERILDDLQYDPNARIRAHILAIGALVRDNIGISKKREGMMKREKALEIRQWIVDHSEPVSRTDEILLYNAMSDLAESHLNNYDHSKASALIQQCRDKYEEWGTEEEYAFEFSKYYHNMAAVMVLQRRFDEAIKLCEQALELTEKVHPIGQGPRWIEFRYNLACYLLQAGDKQGSLKMHKDVKRRREELTGESSYVSLQSCYTIGSIYHHLGDLATAEKWVRKAIARANESNWPKESLCRAQFHLARLLRRGTPKGADTAELDRRAAQATILEKRSKGVLLRLVQNDYPDFLKDVQDEMILFAHIQPVFRGRFTGVELAQLIP